MWWFSWTARSLYSKAVSEPDMTWKLLVVPVCSKSCMMAAKRAAKISKSVSQFCKGNIVPRQDQTFSHLECGVDALCRIGATASKDSQVNTIIPV